MLIHFLAHRHHDPDAADHFGVGVHNRELPPGDYVSRDTPPNCAQGEGVTTDKLNALRAEYGFDQPPIILLISTTGRRYAAGRFRLFVRTRLAALSAGRGRRPAVADRAGLLHHHHLHLADRLSRSACIRRRTSIAGATMG